MITHLKNQIFRIINADNDNYLPSKIFDILIICLICLNVAVIILATFNGFSNVVLEIFYYIEIISIIIFSIEYLLRLWTADFLYPWLKPAKARIKYAFSFMAIIDLLAIIPFYIPFIIPVDLRVLRVIRLLRIVRILKINRYTKALSDVGTVIKAQSAQLLSSFFVVFILMLISSVLMYTFENEAQPKKFQNAFSGLWWAVATFTTVGYGDIIPVTIMGKIFSSITAILGIGLVAVPTGIISAGFVEQMERADSSIMLGIAEEILKYRQLLDIGAITLYEFEEKKHQLLQLKRE